MFQSIHVNEIFDPQLAQAPEDHPAYWLATGFASTFGYDCARTLVSHENDASWGDDAFRRLERRRDCAIGKQSLSGAQRDRIDHQPERINQIMLDQCLKEIPASPNVQIRPGPLLDFGDFFRNIPVQKH